MTLPNFIHAGVPKAASATLNLFFRRHPDIFTTREKEINFFNVSSNFEKGVGWYSKTYFQDATGFRIVSDCSVGYSSGLAIDVPQRIVGALGPDVKLLFVLRHPVDRAYSQYCMAHFKGALDLLPFDRAIDRALSKRGNFDKADIERVQSGTHYSNKKDMDLYRYCVYLETGLYSNILTSFYKYFDPENIMVLLVEDLQLDQQEVADKIFDFLDVERIDVRNLERQNESQTLKRPIAKRAVNRLYRYGPVRYTVNNLIGRSTKRRLRRLLLSGNYVRHSMPPKIEPGVQCKLQSFYYSDIEKTAKLTGRDLNRWLAKYDRA